MLQSCTPRPGCWRLAEKHSIERNWRRVVNRRKFVRRPYRPNQPKDSGAWLIAGIAIAGCAGLGWVVIQRPALPMSKSQSEALDAVPLTSTTQGTSSTPKASQVDGTKQPGSQSPAEHLLGDPNVSAKAK